MCKTEKKPLFTILVNSCDAYEDLWVPFFTLLKRYWNPTNIRILLNTESKDFAFDGLNIECVHSPVNCPYGKRMLNALSHVTTPYVFVLLDDFFIRKPVDIDRINKVISWMEADPDIACFTSDCTKTYADWEVDRYPGFRRVPPGNSFTLNLQAAMWRTKTFCSYWLPNVSPWEWEEYSNILTVRKPRHKFYCTLDWKDALCDYGYKSSGMGVYHGQWVIEDVAPLFEKEQIIVDYSIRGIYSGVQSRQGIGSPEGRRVLLNRICRCLGLRETFSFLLFCITKRIPGSITATQRDYFVFLKKQAQIKFFRENGQESPFSNKE